MVQSWGGGWRDAAHPPPVFSLGKSSMNDQQTVDFSFWRDVCRLEGTADRVVLRRMLCFGLLATLIYVVENLTVRTLAIDITPYEVVGAALSLILVLRTNAGYD